MRYSDAEGAFVSIAKRLPTTATTLKANGAIECVGLQWPDEAVTARVRFAFVRTRKQTGSFRSESAAWPSWLRQLRTLVTFPTSDVRFGAEPIGREVLGFDALSGVCLPDLTLKS